MKLLIQHGRVIDPASGRDERADVAIAAGRIVSIGRATADFDANRRIDASGCIVMPGLVDLAVRLREPGHEHEGMLESELKAAASGGVTSLVCPPDTDPTLDEPGLVEMLKFRARQLSLCRLFPLGALTRGLQGQALTEMAHLSEAGCVGFSQAYTPPRSITPCGCAPKTRGCRPVSPPAARWPRGSGCRACRWRPRRWRCTPSSSWCAPPVRACTCVA
jgi:dihydroorotase